MMRTSRVTARSLVGSPLGGGALEELSCLETTSERGRVGLERREPLVAGSGNALGRL
jgi:hypothetical protein